VTKSRDEAEDAQAMQALLIPHKKLACYAGFVVFFTSYAGIVDSLLVTAPFD
jgi:hypothetical protein